MAAEQIAQGITRTRHAAGPLQPGKFRSCIREGRQNEATSRRVTGCEPVHKRRMIASRESDRPVELNPCG